MELQFSNLSEGKAKKSFCNIRVKGRCLLVFMKSLWTFKFCKGGYGGVLYLCR